jgi:N-dimethylarginine dimethylaminohydrolase
MQALVRPIPKSITNALKLNSDNEMINLEKCIEEHKNYVTVLQSILGANNVIEIKGDDLLPDSCFVEDPVIIIDKKICILRTGHINRRRETDAFREYFLKEQNQKLKNYEIYDMEKLEINMNAFCDGGDIMYLEDINTIFVGISSRTSHDGYMCLKYFFSNKTVIPIKVDAELHLKSVVTFVAYDAFNKTSYLAIFDSDEGESIMEQINSTETIKLIEKDMNLYNLHFEFIYVDNKEMANVVSIRDCKYKNNYSIILKQGFDTVFDELQYKLKSEYINLKLYYIDYNETAKVDGALTCSSIIF